MRVTRATAVLSLATAAVLGLSACSSDTGDKSDRPAAAAEGSEAAEETVDASAELDLTAEDFVDRVTAAAQAAGSVSLSMQTTAMDVTTDATGVVRYLEGGAQEMSMVTTVPEVGEMDMRVVGGMVYMSMGELTGGKFIQVDPSDTSDPMAAQFEGMAGQLDPTGALAGLRDAIRSVEKSGEPEEVGGVLAQPYTVTIDTQAALASQPEALASGASVPAELSYTYWVDGDDLMRRMLSELPEGSIDATFTGWGEPVEITAPPADQITTGF
ncbi:hypothetical protein [Cellulomonas sp. Marseille-Q8402]